MRTIKRHINPATVIALSLAALLLGGCAAKPKPEAPKEVPAAPVPEAPPPLAAFVEEDGRALLEAREYPWSAMGRLNVAGRHFCNGVLMGPDVLLTRASCLYDLVEGHWFQPTEMVFVAAYQRDEARIFSPAARYEIAKGYQPGKRDLRSLLYNWALVRLSHPIGRQAGWIGLADSAVDGSLPLSAGYRRGWEHVQTLYPLCSEVSRQRCPNPAVDGALNDLILTPDGLKLLPGRGTQALADWPLARQGQAPGTGRAIARQAGDSVNRLLLDMGYLATGESRDAAAQKAALRAFQAEAGIRQSGEADLPTLYHLLKELRRRYGVTPVS